MQIVEEIKKNLYSFIQVLLYSSKRSSDRWFVFLLETASQNLSFVFFSINVVNDVSIYLQHCTMSFQVMLEQMQGLMHLELSGCNDFTEAGLWSSLNARLTSLSVSDCINVADDAIAAISQLLPNLSELSLQAYHVTDTAMAYFTAKQV